MLYNSNELEIMHEVNEINNVAIRFGVIGAGQKGNKVADIFAGYSFSNGSPCYPTLALNLSYTDMVHLKNIDKQDRIHFDGLQGAARTPAVVLETFDHEVNPYANEQMEKLTEAIQRKFTNSDGELIIDHLLLDIGAGGGVGTGFGSLFLKLISEGFFPVPVTMMVSLPHDNPEELANALLLTNEINEFFKQQQMNYDAFDKKPLANVILCYNPQMEKIVKSQKGTKELKNQHMIWQNVANDYIASTLHEINIIPGNFGSDQVTYDPSDLQKLFSISGKFLTIGKARIKKQDLHSLESSIQKSLNDSYFTCGHKFETAKTFANILLRPINAGFYQDIETESKIHKVLGEYKDIKQLSGKMANPMWDSEHAVNYTIFGGMNLPEIIGQLTEQARILNEQMQYQEEEESIDVSFLQNKQSSNSFNPLSQGVQNKFGGSHTSAFTRKQPVQEVQKQKQGFGFGNKPNSLTGKKITPQTPTFGGNKGFGNK